MPGARPAATCAGRRTALGACSCYSRSQGSTMPKRDVRAAPAPGSAPMVGVSHGVWALLVALCTTHIGCLVWSGLPPPWCCVTGKNKSSCAWHRGACPLVCISTRRMVVRSGCAARQFVPGRPPPPHGAWNMRQSALGGVVQSTHAAWRRSGSDGGCTGRLDSIHAWYRQRPTQATALVLRASHQPCGGLRGLLLLI